MKATPNDPILSLIALFQPKRGFVAQIGLSSDFPLPRTDLAYGLCLGDTKCSEAVEDCGSDVDLSDLTIEVTCREALTE
ncbi:MAG: hypothetical protein ACI8TF_000785 [Paracoccaceae bacterium]